MLTAYVNGSGHLLDEPAAHVNRFTNDVPLEPCWHCHAPRVRDGKHACRGLCVRCYRRWHSRGYAGDRPPDPRTSEGWLVNDPYVLLDFARLDNPGLPGRTAELCRRFGVSRRTLTRWRARLAQERRRAELLATAAAVCGRTRWRSRLRPGAISGRGSPDAGPGSNPVAAMVAAQVLDQTSSSPACAAYFRA